MKNNQDPRLKWAIVLLLFTIAAAANAQVSLATPSVFATAGKFSTAPTGHSLAWNLGETITTTLNAGSESIGGLTQGFEQPVPLSSSSAPEIWQPENSLLVYPNPSAGMFFVKTTGFPLGDTQPTDFRVFDLLGRLLFEKTGVPFSPKTVFDLDLSGQTAGIYLLEIMQNHRRQVCRLSIQ